jgi:hypothetical protein
MVIARNSGEISPIAAFIGGVAAQEVLKAITNKFMPIKQFLYFDAVECLPANVLDLPPSEFTPSTLDNPRYEAQVNVFGRQFQVCWEYSAVFVCCVYIRIRMSHQCRNCLDPNESSLLELVQLAVSC